MDLERLRASNDNTCDLLQMKWDDHKKNNGVLFIIDLVKIKRFLKPDRWMYMGFLSGIALAVYFVSSWFSNVFSR